MMKRLLVQGGAIFVHLDWHIKGHGRPFGFRVIHNSYGDEKFGNCLVATMERWIFPAPGKDIFAEHRFHFSRKETK